MRLNARKRIQRDAIVPRCLIGAERVASRRIVDQLTRDRITGRVVALAADPLRTAVAMRALLALFAFRGPDDRWHKRGQSDRRGETAQRTAPGGRTG